MSGRDAMQQLASDLDGGGPAVLLGTQMLSKGHHFPGVSLVAIVDADGLLFSSDFRGEERMAQLLTQVAGRAGREGLPGRVLLQSHHPDHPLLQDLLRRDYSELARDLLRQRRDAGLPPAGQLVMLRTDCADPQLAEQFLQELRRLLQPDLPTGCRLLGPLPAAMQRRAGKFRFQLLLSAAHRGAALAASARAVELAQTLPTRRGLNWTIDIDPQEL